MERSSVFRKWPRHQQVEMLEAVVAASPVAIFTLDAQGRIRSANAAAERMFGKSAADLIGTHLVTPDESPGVARMILACAENGTSFTGADFTRIRENGSRLALSIGAAPLNGRHGTERGIVALVSDVTARQRAHRFEHLLHEIDRRILRNQPIDTILSFTCSCLADIYDYALVQLSLKGENGSVTIREGSGPAVGFLSEIEVRWDDTAAGRGPTGTAIRTGSVQFRDLATDRDFAPWRDRAIERGLRCALALPLIGKDQVIGALTLFSAGPIDGDPDTLALLLAFVDQIALSLLAARDQEQITLQTVALESAANAVVVTDVAGVIKWVNPAFTRLTGYSAEEAIGARTSLMKSGNHSDAFYRQMWETLLRGLVWRGEMYNRRKDGTLYIEEQTITPVHAADGRITHFVAIKQDITARRRHEDEIRHLAMHDALTTLPNRRALDGAMERIAFAARHGQPGTLLILDVDNFKPINDTVGHLGGDQLLADLAKLLRSALRPGDFIARLGGDEFAVLLQDTPLDGAHVIAERLRAAVATHPFVFGDFTFDFTISIGVAPIDAVMDAASAMVHADSAMYAAKGSGKNRIVAYPFGEAEGMLLIETSRWASRIRAALVDQRFILRYQPVMHLGLGKPAHYEALVRMVDVDGTIIPPDEFLGAAERFGLMPQIDRWVVTDVLALLAAAKSDFCVFVNISGASLDDAELLSFIEEQIAMMRIPAGRLAFEITESAAIRDLTSAQRWIRRLKELGCLFAIDDFGVGFSSFSYLRALSADYVKIDRSFVTDVDTNPTNRALVQAVITVAQTLGKEVIAEGVETGAHEAVLRELGIELAQGYRWGLPQSPPFA